MNDAPIEQVPIEQGVPIEDPPPLVAHRRAVEALLGDGAVFALASPDAPDWRVNAVELQQPDHVWSILPVAQPEALHALEVVALKEELKPVWTVVLSVAQLPTQALLDRLESTLGLKVIACAPTAVRGGARAAGEHGSLERFEALLARERDPRLDPDERYEAAKQFSVHLLFDHQLRQQAPVPFLTRAVVAVCVLVWLIQVATGVSATSPDVHALRAWGASAPDLTRLEPWRLLTAAFLHGGVLHLGLNSLVLWMFGPYCERLFGRVAFAAIFLTSAAAGFLASAAFNPPVFSAVGASGGIAGLIGAVLGVALLRRDVMPEPVGRRLAKRIGNFILLNAVLWIALSATFPIDHAGHLGGFLVGILGGIGLARPVPPPAREGPRRALVALGLLVAIGVGWTQVRAHPAVRWKALQLRLAALDPQLGEYDAICMAVNDRLLNRKVTDAELKRRAGELRARVAALRNRPAPNDPSLPRLGAILAQYEAALAALETFLDRVVSEDASVIDAFDALKRERDALLEALKASREPE